MSYALQYSLTYILQNNYVSLAMFTAVAYDFVLTFSSEIEYIWSKPWTWVSTLFVIVRYCGLFNVASLSFSGTSFIPAVKTCAFILIIIKVCEILAWTEAWSYVLFLVAADVVMILRVWAMYSRSKIILHTLLALFSVEIISAIVVASNLQNYLSETTDQVLQYSFCNEQYSSPAWPQVTASLQIVFSGTTCVLAIAQFARQSLQMHRATKQWQPNRYLRLLVSDGIIYFFAIFLYNLTNILSASGKLPLANFAWKNVLLFWVLDYIPLYALTPRFIMSIRKIYTHGIQGRRGGGGIDTGFGLSTLSDPNVDGTTMIFADAGPENDSEDMGTPQTA